MFEVGDKVKAFGVDGVVTSIGANDEYPVGVKLTPLGMSSHTDHFDQQGKHLKWHAEPTLVLVEKAKKKVKRYKYLFNSKAFDGYDKFLVSEGYYKDDEDFEIKNPLTCTMSPFEKLEMTEKEFEV